MKQFTVLKSSSQHAVLVGDYSVNPSKEKLIFQYILEGYDALSWGFNFQQVSVILAGKDVSVRPTSKYSYAGCFDISSYINWLYDHSLFSEPEELQNRILSLLSYSLYGTPFDSGDE